MTRRRLLVLDRDGVLNPMAVDADHGVIDSPLHPAQASVFPWVPESLARLGAAGYLLAVATNQPAAAKGKTTMANLVAVDRRIRELAEAAGAAFRSWHACYHRAEDGCGCRKPRTGLLEEALAAAGDVAREDSWMVGDGTTDVAAGKAAGFRTAFLAPRKCSSCRILFDGGLEPDFWGDDLRDLVRFLLAPGAATRR